MTPDHHSMKPTDTHGDTSYITVLMQSNKMNDQKPEDKMTQAKTAHQERKD